MEYKAPIEAYSGAVREITIGKGEKALKIGGENILPFHLKLSLLCQLLFP